MTAKNSKSTAEILAAMVPCARLYAFIGQSLKNALAVGKETPVYMDWINTYSSPEFEVWLEYEIYFCFYMLTFFLIWNQLCAVEVENLLDEIAEEDCIEYKTLTQLYSKAMQLELNFFDAYYSMSKIETVVTKRDIFVLNSCKLIN